MRTVPKPTVGSSSPWGRVQGTREVAGGIVSVETASHGGLWLSPLRAAGILPDYSFASEFYTPGAQWLEEDVEFLRAVLTWPRELAEPLGMSTDDVERARACVLNYKQRVEARS